MYDMVWVQRFGINGTNTGEVDMGDLTIGIDLGGTNIVAAATDANAKILEREKVKTEPGESLAATAEKMREAASQVLETIEKGWDDVLNVGIAIPSAIDPATGDLLHAPNLGWQDEPALATLETVFGCRVFLQNDVNCGVLAEYRLGAARGASTVAGFLVGTGLGGGLIINGRVYPCRRGCAGELGHQIVKVKGAKCGCGNRGCLEAYSSKTGFGRRFRKQIEKKGKSSMLTELVGNNLSNVKSKHLKTAYLADDSVVTKTLNRGARMLGVGAANMMTILAPDCIVFGGGVIEALGEALLPYIREGMEAHLFGVKPEDVSLRISELGDDAVPLGAALVAQAEGNV